MLPSTRSIHFSVLLYPVVLLCILQRLLWHHPRFCCLQYFPAQKSYFSIPVMIVKQGYPLHLSGHTWSKFSLVHQGTDPNRNLWQALAPKTDHILESCNVLGRPQINGIYLIRTWKIDLFSLYNMNQVGVTHSHKYGCIKIQKRL